MMSKFYMFVRARHFYQKLIHMVRKTRGNFPLNIMEHVYGHCCTSPRLREPSGTFMDPQMDPKIDPARLILEDPCRLKALQGPSKVQKNLKCKISFEEGQCKPLVIRPF